MIISNFWFNLNFENIIDILALVMNLGINLTKKNNNIRKQIVMFE